jgi:cellulose biosynthesis protein BcsQ
MKTIIIANQKGGSGKSTLVTHLAVAAERAGDGPVVLTDTDPQGTTADWFNARAAQTPGYAPTTMETQKRAKNKIKKEQNQSSKKNQCVKKGKGRTK